MPVPTGRPRMMSYRRCGLCGECHSDEPKAEVIILPATTGIEGRLLGDLVRPGKMYGATGLLFQPPLFKVSCRAWSVEWKCAFVSEEHLLLQKKGEKTSRVLHCLVIMRGPGSSKIRK